MPDHTATISVEVTTLQEYVVNVDRSDSDWVQKAVAIAEKMAFTEAFDVVSVRGEVVDEEE